MGKPANFLFHPLKRTITCVVNIQPVNPMLNPITLWLFNLAMENCLFIDGLPIKNCDFPWLC